MGDFLSAPVSQLLHVGCNTPVCGGAGSLEICRITFYLILDPHLSITTMASFHDNITVVLQAPFRNSQPYHVNGGFHQCIVFVTSMIV
jgi:hypothetical protein